MALSFTADTHFGDRRRINIPRRPFTTVAEMDAALVPGWKMMKMHPDMMNYGMMKHDDMMKSGH